MNRILSVKIHKNNRNPISLDKNESSFVGRDIYLRKLRNIILNREASTVLIGGVRGVGKTSFVKECIRKIKLDKKTNIAFVDITFADISHDNNADNDKTRLRVLKLLIRGLYFSLPEEERTKEIKQLYSKTYYTEITKNRLFELIQGKAKVVEQIKTNQVVYKIETTNNFSNLMLNIGATVIGFSGLTVSIAVLNDWFILLGILGTLALLFGLLRFSKNIAKEETERSENTTLFDEKIGGNDTGVYDLSSDTFENEIKTLLSNQYNNGTKVVFVIDELDKLNEKKDIFEIIKPLKNLFSLSKATFIFIDNEKSFDKLEEMKVNNPYSSEHTLFTDRIFLNSMYSKEISAIVDNYKDNIISSEDENTYEKFQYYISWKARNHIFDTHNLLDQFIDINDNEELFINLDEETQEGKGNLDRYWYICSYIQIYISATFENFRYKTKNRLNEKLYLALREVGQVIFDDTKIEVNPDDYISILNETTLKNIEVDNLSSDERDDFNGAIESLITNMERHHFLKRDEDETKTLINGETIEYMNFSLDKMKFIQEEVLKNTKIPLDYELKLVELFKELTQQKENILKYDEDIFDEYNQELKKMKYIVDNISSESNNREHKSTIMDLQKRIAEIMSEIKEALLKNIANEIAQTVNGNVISILRNISAQPMKVADKGVARFYNYLSDQINEDHFQIIQLKERYALISFDLDKADQVVYLKIKRYTRSKSKSKFINMIFKSDIENEGRQPKWTSINASEDYSDISRVVKNLKKQAKKYLLN